MAGHAQHPHQAGGDHPVGVVVGHDDVRVADAGARHALGEDLRRRQGVPAVGSTRRTGQPPLEVDEDGAREVAGGVRRARGQAGDVAADVGQDDLARVLLPPGAGDEGTDHGPDAIGSGARPGLRPGTARSRRRAAARC